MREDVGLFTLAIGTGMILEQQANPLVLVFPLVLGALLLLAFQGSLALLGAILGEFLPAASIAAMTATGRILLLGVGLRLLEVKKVEVGDMLPAVFIAPALAALQR